MYYICALPVFRNINLFHSISKHPLKNIVNQHKKFSSSSRFPIDVLNNLNKDILLYSFERSKFYKYLSLFGLAQFTVWSFYAGLMYVNTKDLTIAELEKFDFFTRGPLWKRAFGENRGLFSGIALCVSIGVLATAVCTILPSRMIKQLTLCKGGQSAILVTYGPFGKTLKREVPLRSLSCVTSRSEAKSYLAIRVKPKWFFYLIDIRGKFHNPKLFDYTLGTKAFKAY